MRYAKVWLLIISIILHFMCLTVSLGSFVVINSVAASRYGACTSFYNPFYDHVIYEQQAGNGLVDKSGSAAAVNNCLSTNFKYANIAMILLGATCMVMFVSFFIKLVAAFNNVHSSREWIKQLLSHYFIYISAVTLFFISRFSNRYFFILVI